jgi:hypothetical protein
MLEIIFEFLFEVLFEGAIYIIGKVFKNKVIKAIAIIIGIIAIGALINYIVNKANI